MAKGYGTSEEIISDWSVQDSKRRDRIVLATKVYQPMETGPNDKWMRDTTNVGYGAGSGTAAIGNRVLNNGHFRRHDARKRQQPVPIFLDRKI